MELFSPETIKMTLIPTINGVATDPKIFGPPLWFILHNSAVMYPELPTVFIQNSMIRLIESLHLLIPCKACKEHFCDFIRYTNLKRVTSSRHYLFQFFVDVHNFVNKRHQKPEMDLETAKRIYSFDAPEKGALVGIKYNN